MILSLALALAAQPDAPPPRVQCAQGDLLACLTAIGEASRLRAWAAEPNEEMPVVRRYDVEAYAAHACVLGQPALCGFAEAAPARLWRNLPPGATWLPGDPVALPDGAWTSKQGDALGFAGHRLPGDVVGTGQGLLVVEDGALVLYDADGRQPVKIPGDPKVCRLEARAKVVRVGFLKGEDCDRGAMVLDLLTGREADVPPERRRPRTATMDDGSVVELLDGALEQRTAAGDPVRAWPLDTSLPQHLVPHPDGLSVAVVQATGSLIVPLVEGFGTVGDVPAWLPAPAAEPGPGRVAMPVPAWARSVCELSPTEPDRPMRAGDVVRLGPETLSLPDRARGMTLIATSSPSGCTDGTPQDAARWPPTAEQLALLTPSAKAFKEVERRTITIVDDRGEPVVGMPIEVNGRLAYRTETGLDGTFLWWDEGGAELVVGPRLDMPTMKAGTWELPASPQPPGGKPARTEDLVGIWSPGKERMAWVFLTPDDIGRGWALVSPTRMVHIASNKRVSRVVQCRGCAKPTRYERITATGSLTGGQFVGGMVPAESMPYTTRLERPNLHRALPADIAARLEDVGATDPARLEQPGGPLLAALTGRTLEKDVRTDVGLVAHGTTYAATVRYEGKDDCGAGKNACASLVMEIFGGFERWVVEPTPLRVHRIERRDDRGEVVEILDVTWE